MKGENKLNRNNNSGEKPSSGKKVRKLLRSPLAYVVVLPIRSTAQKEISYSEFLKMMDEGRVESVEVRGDELTIKPVASDELTDPVVYTAKVIYNEQLVERMYAAGVDFYAEEVSQSVGFADVLFMLPMIGLVIVFGYMFFSAWRLNRRMKKGAEDDGNSVGGFGGLGFGAGLGVGKSSAKLFDMQNCDVRFSDVAGQTEAKESLIEVVDILKNPSRYTSVGAQIPKGALLVGPPGTGKTLLARAVAGEAGCPFFFVSGSAFVEMFVGAGAARVRDLFKQAAAKAPCIVFIDEFDAIGKKRDGSGLGGNDEREQTLNQLLAEMDGFDPGKGIIVLGATNRPEILDKALLRPGRFDRRIPVELPDLKGRLEILEVHAKKKVIEPEVSLKSVADATPGASGAELANILNEAALFAVRDHRSAISQHDLEQATEYVIAGSEKKSMVISPEEKRIISYHEIGHALVAAKQKNAVPIRKITIIPRTSGALGFTMQADEEEKFLMKKEDLIQRLEVLTAGRAAEEMMFGTVTSGAANDIEQATKIARQMITRFGMSDEIGFMAVDTVSNPYLDGELMSNCSEATSAKVEKEMHKLISEAYARAMTILRENAEDLNRLAQYLLLHENITGEEFMSLLG